MAALTAGACFSAHEIELISADPQAVMHVMTIDNPAELHLLRTPSTDLAVPETAGEPFRVLCARMMVTVNDPAHRGVGIAAPQVGVLKRVVAVQRFDAPDEPFGIYVNPRIIKYSSECEVGNEGCLSVPNLSGGVSRAKCILITYWDPVSEMQVRETVEGFTAIIFQHEIDHLDGIIFTEKIAELPVEQVPEP